jgi:D-aminopeptidase
MKDMTDSSRQSSADEPRARARDIGISIGMLAPGLWNAITDVPGVRVGHCTLISGEGPLVAGRGPVRTGVTAVIPRDDVQHNPVFAGYHVLNGCGEMTGLHWVGEAGFLSSIIGLTGTFGVGAVHEAFLRYGASLGLPVVAETWDGDLSDVRGMHVRAEHVRAALDAAASGPVAEGGVGGGTGMICHGFKGGIGTSSRVLPAESGGWTVGALVQANHGQRRMLRVNGVPVGQFITHRELPDPRDSEVSGGSSIIVIVATDAPLAATQCRRLAQRATLGVGRAGGLGENGSGDIFLAFSTANAGLHARREPGQPLVMELLPNDEMTPLFEAVADATEEAILNALCAATTMAGFDGQVAPALPLGRVRGIVRGYGELAGIFSH